MTIELTASVIVPTTILDTGAFTRSTTATYFDVDGVMQTAAIDVPRIGYDPVTHAHTGLILEGAGTNLLSGSQTVGGTYWDSATSGLTATVNSDVAPDGSTTASLLNDTSTSIVQFADSTQAIAADTQTRTFSCYLKAGTAAKSAICIFALGGSPSLPGGIFAVIEWATGTLTTGGTGTFYASMNSVGNGWYRLALSYVNTNNTSIYCRVSPAGLFSETVNTGTCYAWGAQLEVGSVATSYIPTTSAAVTRAADVVTGSGLIYCTTPEPATAETLWNAATSYTVGQVVARTTTHHLYENLIAGVNATLPELATTGATPRWLDLGATNRWSQFDQKIGTATTSTTSLTTIVKPGLGEGLALLDLIGVTAKISATDAGSGVVIFERTVDLDSTTIESVFDWMFSDRVQKRNVVITDIPAQYPNMVVAVTIESTTGSAIGVFAVGRAIFIGATEYGAGAGIINFGKVTDDGFGNRTWIEGDWANRVTLPMVGNTSDFNRIHRQLATVRSTPCIYIGSALDSMEPLVCYGVFRDLYITVPNYPTIAMNLEIDGMSNS